MLRKTRAPAKYKFFFWLVIHDRCWTATRRKKHGLQDDNLCAFCAQAPESIDHLLIQCPFSREVWFNLFCRIGWHSVSPTNQNSWVVDWWTLARKSIHKDERQCFDSMVTLMCWMLWKERNGRIFDQRFRTVADVLVGVIDEIVAWSRAGFTTTETLICLGWETLVIPISQPGTPGRNKREPFYPGSGNRD